MVCIIQLKIAAKQTGPQSGLTIEVEGSYTEQYCQLMQDSINNEVQIRTTSRRCRTGGVSFLPDAGQSPSGRLVIEHSDLSHPYESRLQLLTTQMLTVS